MSIPHHSTNRSTLHKLLQAGASRAEAARTLNITPSAVTQLAPQDPQDPQAESIERSTQIDAQYDHIESQLLKQLERTIPLLLRPGEIARTLQIVNSAKRRGVAAAREHTPTHVLNLTLPTTIQNKFVTNSSNQVVRVGKQDLVTLPSAAVTTLLDSHNEQQLPAPPEEDEFGLD